VLHSAALVVALLVLLAWLVGVGEMIVRGRRTARLSELPAGGPETLPSVSVVVAARNEAATVEAGVRSLLGLRYPRLEVIVVEDRSTDETPAILARLAAEEPGIHLVTVERLPPGWLGKNHALAVGAARATGEWILFTDADVHLAPSSLARAVEHARTRGLDHLAIAPTLHMRGVALTLFASGFALLFAQFTRPWRARDPRSPRHIGIGAFNLVRAEAYRAAGGHEPISMRPDDDLRLGKILKEAGYSQDFAVGGDQVVVEWYSSFREAVRGLEKNTFAGVDYSLPKALLSGFSLALLGLYPVAALLVGDGAVRTVAAITCLWITVIYAGSMRASGGSPLLAPAFPVAVLLILFVAGRATALTLLRGGIRWRDTFYPLAELRSGGADRGPRVRPEPDPERPLR
jgi:glycosyltransferase involved in cell wall biosynthesis